MVALFLNERFVAQDRFLSLMILLFHLANTGIQLNGFTFGDFLLFSEILHLKHHRLNFLFEHLPGILQRFEFAFACGNRHLAVAEFVAGILQAGLKLGLFSQQLAFGAAGLSDLASQRVKLNYQFVDLISARKYGVVFLALALPACIDAKLAK